MVYTQCIHLHLDLPILTMSHFFTCYFPDNRLNNLCIVPSPNENSNVQLKCTERFDLCLFYCLLRYISSPLGLVDSASAVGLVSLK